MTPKLKNSLALSFAVGPILLAVIVLSYNAWPAKKFAQDKAFFSDDDGKTWYVDSVDMIPPYDHNGHEADGALIYSYKGGSKQFCGFLFRFPPKVKAQVEKTAAAGPGQTPHGVAYGTEIGNSREVKAPGSPGPWVRMGTREATAIMQVHPPDGGTDLDQVLP